MTNSPDKEITRVLTEVAAGDNAATDRLLPLVYDELRRLAGSRIAKLPPGQTLQATALVHEAYLRVAKNQDAAWDGRYHFFFAASRAMRDILVEDARRKSSARRGGGRRRIPLDESGLAIEPPKGDILGVNEALEKLEKEDPEKAQIVLLRYFSGLTTEETAEILGVSLSTVERKWRFIRAWLQRELSSADSPAAGPSNG